MAIELLLRPTARPVVPPSAADTDTQAPTHRLSRSKCFTYYEQQIMEAMQDLSKLRAITSRVSFSYSPPTHNLL